MNKKKVGLGVLLICGSLISCSDEYTICSLSKVVNLQAGLYDYATVEVTPLVAPALTITPVTGPATAYDNFAGASSFLVKLEATADSVIYKVKLGSNFVADSVTFVYSTTDTNLSFECGSINVHRILRANSTHNTIDSISITGADVTNLSAENIRIFF